VTVAHLDRPMYLLGYLPSTGRLYLCDKDVQVVSYELQLAVLLYQTAVMNGDMEEADRLLPEVPVESRTRVAHFLEKQGFLPQALVVSKDSEHRFELAVRLQQLSIAREMAEAIGSPQKWKQLGEVAMRASNFDLAEECMEYAKDYSGLLLLYTTAGKYDKLGSLGATAGTEEKTNIAFMALLLQGKVDECIELLVKTNRLAEAALFARSYAPSKVSEVVALWKEDLGKVNPKAAAALADPAEYPNLFPELSTSLKAEASLRADCASAAPAAEYASITATRATPLADRVGDDGGDDEAVADEEEAAAADEADTGAAEEPAAEEPAAEEGDELASAEEGDGDGDLDLDDDEEDLLGEDEEEDGDNQ